MFTKIPMKSVILAVLLNIIFVPFIEARARIISFDEMVHESNMIVVADIVKLIPADKSQNGRFRDWVAIAKVKESIKGTSVGEINFYIKNFYPCALVDITTGTYLVFLSSNPLNDLNSQKDPKLPKVDLINSNWGFSLLPVNANGVRWFRNNFAHTNKEMLTIPEARLIIDKVSEDALPKKAPHSKWWFWRR